MSQFTVRTTKYGGRETTTVSISYLKAIEAAAIFLDYCARPNPDYDNVELLKSGEVVFYHSVEEESD